MRPPHQDVSIEFIQELSLARKSFCFAPGTRHQTQKLIDRLLGLLFPHFAETLGCGSEQIEGEIAVCQRELQSLLNTVGGIRESTDTREIASRFLGQLGDVQCLLAADATAIDEWDPASSSVDEVILAYPGFRAIAIYRLAHVLQRENVKILPRLMSEIAHEMTGIDIHPGATIQSPFLIDHGTGIVIGETTVIGANVKVYQGVTLGATSVRKKMLGVKRHPTIEDDVVL
ncbi:MAG: serine acetyltransferase, partial [Armatimonadetes bacterium]|nr:serine acetyltransferase [Armatimonadota bacterium]